MHLRIIDTLLAVASLAILTGCDDPRAIRDLIPIQNHYTASTSMEPTLPKGVQLMSHSVSSDEVRRGDILIVRTSRGEDYVLRLIGLPGDTIELVDGRVILNGEGVKQIPAGKWEVSDERVAGVLDAFTEQLPGSDEAYRILNDGQTFADNMAPVSLPDNRFFFLGDNRDHSADSRFSEDFRGVGLVAGEQIKRRVDFDWSH